MKKSRMAFFVLAFSVLQLAFDVCAVGIEFKLDPVTLKDAKPEDFIVQWRWCLPPGVFDYKTRPITDKACILIEEPLGLGSIGLKSCLCSIKCTKPRKNSFYPVSGTFFVMPHPISGKKNIYTLKEYPMPGAKNINQTFIFVEFSESQ